MIKYISDMHFGHKNVIKFDKRPFHTIEEMDKFIIREWNKKTDSKDDVYIIGDVCCKSAKSPKWYLEQLNGKKHLIIGNHDKVILNDNVALSFFESINEIKIIDDDGKKVVLCHYPMAEWPEYYHGAYHIYGHIHESKGPAYYYMKRFDNAFNAAATIVGYAPVSFDELKQKNIEYKQKNN